MSGDYPAEYLRYCKAWKIFIKANNIYNHYKCRLFLEGMKDFLLPGYRVHEWPTVWPNVEMIFGTSERFTEAVEANIPRLPEGFL